MFKRMNSHFLKYQPSSYRTIIVLVQFNIQITKWINSIHYYFSICLDQGLPIVQKQKVDRQSFVLGRHPKFPISFLLNYSRGAVFQIRKCLNQLCSQPQNNNRTNSHYMMWSYLEILRQSSKFRKISSRPHLVALCNQWSDYKGYGLLKGTPDHIVQLMKPL